MLPLLLAFPALAALALSMPGHRRAALDGALPSRIPRALLVALGSALALLALFSASRQTGWPIGIVLWLSALAVAGFAVTLTLAYLPKRLPLLAATILVLTLSATFL